MWNLSESVDNLNLVNAVDAWTEPSVDTEDTIVDDTGEREIVEHVGEMVPHGCVAVLSTALGIEAVGLRDASRFVVASDQVDPVGVSQFETNEQGYSLYTKKTTIDVVALRG